MKNIKSVAYTKEQCKTCGSFALNEFPESGLCDVCYWKEKYERAKEYIHELLKYDKTQGNLNIYLFEMYLWALDDDEKKPDKKDFGL